MPVPSRGQAGIEAPLGVPSAGGGAREHGKWPPRSRPLAEKPPRGPAPRPGGAQVSHACGMCVAVLPMPCTCPAPARLRGAAVGKQGAHRLGHTDVSRVGPGGVMGACQREVLGRRAGSSEELEQEERRELMV